MQVELPDWFNAVAQMGDRFQVIYLASVPVGSSQLQTMKTTLGQRPDLSVDSVTLTSPQIVSAVVLELYGPQQLGPQLARGVYPGDGVDYTVQQVIQVGGSNIITRAEAKLAAMGNSASTATGNAAIETTNAVKNALPTLGFVGAIAVPALLFIGLFAYGRGERH